MKFKIIIEKDGNGFHGYIPELKGLHTQGDTIEETLGNVGNGLSAYMQSMVKHGDKLKDIQIKEKIPHPDPNRFHIIEEV